MKAWSQAEAARTIEEVKRRSLADPEFRALALSNPLAAVVKVNPRPVPVGSIRFMEAGETAREVNTEEMIVAVLPAPKVADELSDEDLEEVAGGGGNPPPPPVGMG